MLCQCECDAGELREFNECSAGMRPRERKARARARQMRRWTRLVPLAAIILAIGGSAAQAQIPAPRTEWEPWKQVAECGGARYFASYSSYDGRNDPEAKFRIQNDTGHQIATRFEARFIARAGGVAERTGGSRVRAGGPSRDRSSRHSRPASSSRLRSTRSFPPASGTWCWTSRPPMSRSPRQMPVRAHISATFETFPK